MFVPKRVDNGIRQSSRRTQPPICDVQRIIVHLPVLRYRAMTHSIAAPGLVARPYFNRFTDDAIDLCDVLSSFSSQAKATLHEVCGVMGLPGKGRGETISRQS
jgi:predicted 3'-5' exonuclease similar to PolB exonuclease domain